MKVTFRFFSLLSIAIFLAFSLIGIQPSRTAHAVVNIIYVDDDASAVLEGFVITAGKAGGRIPVAVADDAR